MSAVDSEASSTFLVQLCELPYTSAIHHTNIPLWGFLAATCKCAEVGFGSFFSFFSCSLFSFFYFSFSFLGEGLRGDLWSSSGAAGEYQGCQVIAPDADWLERAVAGLGQKFVERQHRTI